MKKRLGKTFQQLITESKTKTDNQLFRRISKQSAFVHKNCGGELIESKKKVYKYERDNGKIEKHNMIQCKKCKKEILGDKDVVQT